MKPLPIFIALAMACMAAVPLDAGPREPNLIIIFTDDQGYEDLGCFGSKAIKTPRLDRMASEGLRLTNFYAQPVCGVSRAALMTGCYPIRVGEPRNVKQLHTVPHPEEVTMAEVLKSAGYATALIGKWHLVGKGRGPGGVDMATMPNAQGFDFFYGTPRFNGYTVFVEDTKMRSPIMRNERVEVEAVQSWDTITADYTKEAIQWITKNKEQPFFLYLAHNMPHIPVGASEKFIYYSGCLLTGVRVGQWKLVLPRPGNPPGTGWWGRMVEEIQEVQLYDLGADPGETTNVAVKHPEVIAKLMKRIKAARSELGDMDVIGSGARFFDEGPRRIPSMPPQPRG